MCYQQDLPTGRLKGETYRIWSAGKLKLKNLGSVWSKKARVHHFEGYLLNEFVHIILLEDIWDFVVQGILQKVGILAKFNLPQALLIYIIELPAIC